MTFADDPVLLWSCVTDRSAYHEEVVRARDRLADAARDARWTDAFALLDEAAPEHVVGQVEVNDVRVGGKAGFTPLHQAAWHGASDDVVEGLLARGAWRSLRSTSGETPSEVADRRGHARLAERLRTRGDVDLVPVRDMETLFAALIVVETHLVTPTMRMPQLGPLVDTPRVRFHCAIPGMFGGVFYQWSDHHRRDALSVNFSSRMDADSGTHFLVSPREIRKQDSPPARPQPIDSGTR